MKFVEIKLLVNFSCKVRAIDRFQHKLEGEQTKLNIFVSIFLHYNLLNKLILHYCNNNLLQVVTLQ